MGRLYMETLLEMHFSMHRFTKFHLTLIGHLRKKCHQLWKKEKRVARLCQKKNVKENC